MLRRAQRISEFSERAAYLASHGELSAPEDQKRIAIAHATALIGAGQPDAAARLLDNRERRDGTDLSWMEVRLRAAVLTDDDGGIRRMTHALKGRAGGSSAQLANVQRLLARAYLEAGDRDEALTALEEAQRLHPRDDTLRLIARTGEAMGSFHRALTAWSTLCDQNPASADCDERDRLRRKFEPARVSPQPPP